MKNLILFLSLLFLCFSACRKDMNDITINVEEDPPLVFVETAIKGRVVDDSGRPVANASVNVGNTNIFSGADGFFEIDQLGVRKSGDVVSADVPGFFTGISQANFAAEGESFIEIQVLSKGEPDIVSSSVDASIVKPNGLSLDIPANSILDSNGNKYNGNVMVYSKWIDPTSEDLGGIMPGSLVATDQSSKDVVLATYGMLVLDLEAENGEQLSIEEDAFIEVSLPIPDDLMMAAPDEIPLWEFDLEEGRWLESGKCNNTGSSYTCLIPGTGYWNCDIPLESICLSVQVFFEDETAGSFVKVVVEDLTDNFIYWGYTDVNGFLCGSVPQSAPLKLTILDRCDNILYMEEIGVFDEDAILDDIFLDSNVGLFTVGIKGSLSHCIQTDVPQGHIGVRYPGALGISTFVDGAFDVNFGLLCTDFPELEITVYSTSEPNATQAVTIFASEDVDLGAQAACEELEDLFDFEVDDVGMFASPTQYSFRSNQTTDWLVMEGLSGLGTIKLELRDYQGLGVYDVNAFCELSAGTLEPSFENLEGSSPSIQVEITEDDGTFIAGNFSGILENELGEEKTISGTFKVKKAP